MMDRQFIFEAEPFEVYSEFDEHEEEQPDVYSEFDAETGFFNSAVRKEKSVEDRCTSDYIRWVQSSLNQVMGLRLKVNSIPGRLTRSAIRSFQKRQGFKPDGFVGPQGINVILKDMRQHGFQPTSWSEFKQYVERRQEELRRLIGAKPGSGWDPITGIRNADFALRKGKELTKQLGNF